MKNDILKTASQVRTRYVPARMEVTDITVQDILCLSGGNDSSSEEDWGTGGFTTNDKGL